MGLIQINHLFENDILRKYPKMTVGVLWVDFCGFECRGPGVIMPLLEMKLSPLELHGDAAGSSLGDPGITGSSITSSTTSQGFTIMAAGGRAHQQVVAPVVE